MEEIEKRYGWSIGMVKSTLSVYFYSSWLTIFNRWNKRLKMGISSNGRR